MKLSLDVPSQAFFSVRFAVVPSLMLTVNACSFVAVNGPPRGHETMPAFECTQNRTLPVVDGLLAGAWIYGAVTDSREREGLHDYYDTVLVLGIGTLYGTSSVFGFRSVRDCRSAKEDLARRSTELARLRMMAREP